MGRTRSSPFATPKHVPISVRALTQRLNRLLATDGKELRKTRGAPAIDALGHYYVLGANGVLSHHVDLETFGRETGVLATYERLITEN